jgi:hypothetical protein
MDAAGKAGAQRPSLTGISARNLNLRINLRSARAQSSMRRVAYSQPAINVRNRGTFVRLGNKPPVSYSSLDDIADRIGVVIV